MSDVPRPLPGRAPAQADPMVGRALSERYRIDRLIARGGMARVYRARDLRLERDVAVKILSPPYADDSAFAGRFLGEARAAASLSHPSLVHVYDSGSDGAAHYIVMELLERHRTLRQVLNDHGPLPGKEVIRIGRELLAGLRAVHDRGLVHCDVKSSNVMLGPRPAKLIDFGIARSAHGGTDGDTSIGSLQSMSPEQLHGEPLSPASDLFSVGVVLYEALTGRLPYPGRTPAEVSEAHHTARVPPPSSLARGVPGRLDEAILQALRREPERRFGSAEAMSRALDAAAAEAPTAPDDETRVVRTRSSGSAAGRGYVPPPPEPVPARRTHPAPRTPPRRPAPARRRGGSNLWGLLGTLAVLAAAAAVVLFIAVPLVELGREGGGGGAGPTDPAVSPTPGATPAPNRVTVPNTVGLPTGEAIELATQAGLDWTVRCAEDRSLPEGIIEQEPPAGTEVGPGSPFTMYSARYSDCS